MITLKNGTQIGSLRMKTFRHDPSIYNGVYYGFEIPCVQDVDIDYTKGCLVPNGEYKKMTVGFTNEEDAKKARKLVWNLLKTEGCTPFELEKLFEKHDLFLKFYSIHIV
jgi:hypothetical protein